MDAIARLKILKCGTPPSARSAESLKSDPSGTFGTTPPGTSAKIHGVDDRVEEAVEGGMKFTDVPHQAVPEVPKAWRFLASLPDGTTRTFDFVPAAIPAEARAIIAKVYPDATVEPWADRVSTTSVVHCQREPYNVYIGRAVPRLGLPASPWANPYRIGRDGDRAEVIAKYRAWILTQPELMARLPELRGKRLGCWCSPLPCHGDVLAALAEGGLR